MDYSKVTCPKCNASSYSVQYTISTATYSPITIKDGQIIDGDCNYYTHYCTCLSCGTNFSVREYYGEIENISKQPSFQTGTKLANGWTIDEVNKCYSTKYHPVLEENANTRIIELNNRINELRFQLLEVNQEMRK